MINHVLPLCLSCRLDHFTNDLFYGPVTHVRIDACLNCSGYIKMIDSRKSGHAEPIVDKLASLELDLWADEQGLRKLKRNLLGF